MPTDFFFLAIASIIEDNHVEVIRSSNPHIALQINTNHPDFKVITNTLSGFFAIKEHSSQFEIIPSEEKMQEKSDGEEEDNDDVDDQEAKLWFYYTDLSNKQTKTQINMSFSFSGKCKTDKKDLLLRRLRVVFLHHEIVPLGHQAKFREKLWSKIGQPVFVQKSTQVHISFLMFWKVGSGKSYAALQLFSLVHVPRIIVICSNTMISVWKDFICDLPQPTKSQTVFTVIGISEFSKRIHNNPKLLQNQIVIFDEAHSFRNVTENMKDQIESLNSARLVFNLTGTPVVNDLSDIIGLVLASNGKLNTKELAILKGESAFDKAIVFSMLDRVFTDRIDFYDPKMQIEHMHDYPTTDMQITYVNMTLAQSVDYMVQKRQDFHIGHLQFCTSRRSAFNTTSKRISNSSSVDQLSPKFLAVCDNVLKLNRFPQLIMSSYLENGVVPICKHLQQVLDQKKHLVQLMTGETRMTEREKIMNSYNEGKVAVLGLSKIGEFGLTFLNTQMVNLVDSYDNFSTEWQAIHRAVRYRSHKKTDDGKTQVVLIMKYVSKFPPREEFIKNADFIEKYFYDNYCNSKQATQEELITFNFTKEFVKKIEKEEEWRTVDERIEISNRKKYDSVLPIVEHLQELGSK